MRVVRLVVTRRWFRRHRMGVRMTIEEAYANCAEDLVRYAVALTGRDDAADVVADAFAGLLRRGSDMWLQVRDPRRYLFVVVSNEARARHRATTRRLRREAIVWERASSVDTPADPSVIRAVGRLSVQQRAVIYLTYWEDMTTGAVAEVLGISEGATKRQLARARNKLREVLA